MRWSRSTACSARASGAGDRRGRARDRARAPRLPDLRARERGALPVGCKPMTDTPYPRDMVGYGRNRPHPRWPGEARIAVQFVIKGKTPRFSAVS